ncbi:unnamed protein product [Brassica rapa]|uniref:Uncharacterized protein n=2 Tax=Brassica TaxID=3705 RepID=A0A3P6CGS7_BRACM|nr:unnamed protein product [Brassica napus]CAG7906406.1 unnamed protein product [Brassica rapa]VDD12214.1 unnamed protein product [Brassica rapa]
MRNFLEITLVLGIACRGFSSSIAPVKEEKPVEAPAAVEEKPAAEEEMTVEVKTA